MISPDSLSLALISAVIYTFTEGQQIRRRSKGKTGRVPMLSWMPFPKNNPHTAPFSSLKKTRKSENTAPRVTCVSWRGTVHPPSPSLPTSLPTEEKVYVKIPTSEDLLKLSTFKAEYISIPWHRYMSTFVYHVTKIRISQWFYSFELKTRTQMSIYSRMDKPIAKYSPSGIPYNS